jgi:superfamily I DNA and/or RNA helicase
LEYLWGSTYFNDAGERDFRDFWGHDVEEEKKAFTDFVDWAFERWRRDPSMHIYHYGSYEITALRRLMGNYGIREHEVDTLLRNEVFIDLYNIIRHGVLIGEPSYSIKNVEHIYREKRDTEVSSGGDSILVYEKWRAKPDGFSWKTSKVLKAIRDYNIDDCNSTQELTEWLRSEQLSHNIVYSRSLDKEEEKEKIEEETEITLLRDKLLQKALIEENEIKQSVLKNLAWILEFHRRENKPTWWRLFDRLGLTELDLHDDMECLVGLTRTNKEPYLHTPRARNKTYEYAFDVNQPFKGQSKSFYVLGDENFKLNTISFNDDEGLICLQSKEIPPNRISLIPDQFVNPAPIPKAIQDVVETNLQNDFKQSAISDFLFRKKPRFFSGPKNPILKPNLLPEDFIKSIIMAANDLDNSYLCIQGPPGAGKTFTARNVICDLISKGKRIGISSNSHKAIVNLMDGVAEHLIQNNISGNLIKIGGSEEDSIFDKKNVFFKRDAKAVGNNFNDSPICVGGTAWLFCNSQLSEQEGIKKFDYLFIDEAGQVSVANLVGMSRIAENIILMGDQMQLGQPSQGSHPDESGQSILDYLLQDKSTIPPDMGIFLPKTYRMHPDLCKIISDQVYDNRLIAAEVTNKHIIDVPPEISPRKHGIYYIPVFHEGNTQGSEEEVEIIKGLSEKLINIPFWSENSQHETRKIKWSDILFVAPYNYQVNLLRNALHSEARIGSVDKFQGQEAPIVFVSMCASNASESPRGIEFLFSKNRLNVAISRAQSLVIVVGSPKLVTTPVNNLKQMELVNFYAEIVKSGS